MKFDFTINLALLITLCSLVLPTLTTIANNRHQIKMRKLDFTLDKKFSIIEAYIESVGNCLELCSRVNLSQYNKAKGMLYLYVPKKLHKQINELDICIQKQQINTAKSLFDVLCIDLSNVVKQK